MGGAASKDCGGDGADPDHAEEPGCQSMKTTRTNLIYLNRAQNKFSILLFQEFAKDGKKPGNQLVGCLGLSIGLGLVCIGAQGKSKEEMLKALQCQEFMQNLQMENSMVEEELMVGLAAMHWDTFRTTASKGCTVEMAVRLFAPMEIKMTADYEEICNTYKLNTVLNVEFVKRHDKARIEINDWATQATHGIAQQVVPPMGIVDRDTNLFLLCVTYIKVRWKNAFESRKTSKMPFYLQMKEVLQVHMMYQQTEIRYGDSAKLDCDLIELPFANDYTKMYVLLPKKKDGVSKIEKNISRSVLENAIEDMCYEIVDLYLPRFTFESSYPIVDKLQAMGIKEVFNAKSADLAMLSAADRFCLSSVYHHIQLEFEESESCHASATNIAHLSVPSNMPSDPKDIKLFKADHPFVFVIKDDRTGAIWVIGRVVRPTVV